MPELPEVELLVRHLRPRVVGRRITRVEILRARSVRGGHRPRLIRSLLGRRITNLCRRAKYLRFNLERDGCFLVHLGMTGRLWIGPSAARARHDVARIGLGRCVLVFHDPRKFGHITASDRSLRRLGPEPLESGFTNDHLAAALARSRAPIKPRLLDQTLVAGLGNIYVCEALWRARIDPRTPCCRLGGDAVARLRRAIRATLREAIRFGGGLSLNFDSSKPGDGLFYYGSGRRRNNPAEHFAVYDRRGEPCRRCRRTVVRITQAGRSTFYCPACQADRRPNQRSRYLPARRTGRST
jgi:formamidopyrimidine-DNA glycosylase